MIVYEVWARQLPSFERNKPGPIKVKCVYWQAEHAHRHCADLRAMPQRATGDRREFGVRERTVRLSYDARLVAAEDSD